MYVVAGGAGAELYGFGTPGFWTEYIESTHTAAVIHVRREQLTLDRSVPTAPRSHGLHEDEAVKLAALAALLVVLASRRGADDSDAERAFRDASRMATSPRSSGSALQRPITSWTDDAWAEAARLAERSERLRARARATSSR